jgi:acyl carrier protein
VSLCGEKKRKQHHKLKTIVKMEKNELIAKINETLADEFEVEVADITPDANIKETLQLDSLSLVDMVALIEAEFGVKIKGSEMVQVQTFQALYDFIAERTA